MPRLSKLQIVDDAALPAVQRAYDRIRSERMTQVAVHRALNDELAALGQPLISLSSVNRWAAKIMEGRVRRPEPNPH